MTIRSFVDKRETNDWIDRRQPGPIFEPRLTTGLSCFCLRQAANGSYEVGMGRLS